MTREMQEFVSIAAPIMRSLWRKYKLPCECQLRSLNILGHQYKGLVSYSEVEYACHFAVIQALHDCTAANVGQGGEYSE